MAFTDDDLKRYKERFCGSMSDPFKAEALLARLEAAEKLIAVYPTDEVFDNLLEVWRKAAGK